MSEEETKELKQRKGYRRGRPWLLVESQPEVFGPVPVPAAALEDLDKWVAASGEEGKAYALCTLHRIVKRTVVRTERTVCEVVG